MIWDKEKLVGESAVRIFKNIPIISLSILLPVLTACDSTSSKGTSDPGISTGVFIDSAVANIAYRTGSQSGFTNEKGEYQYRGGEQVIFSIGAIDFPSAPARRIVTPLDLVNTDQVDNPIVLNISRLLLSLDVDGNPDNGITIGDQAASIAQGMSIDFSSPTFEADVSNLVANSGSVNTVLVSAIAAQIHMQEQLALIPPDRDDDGVIDTADIFPDDPNESADRDGDGVGDNGDYAPDDAAIQSICQTSASVQELEQAGCSNTLPIAVFVGEQTVAPLAQVSLDGSSSYDPEGQSLTYLWEIISKPNGAVAVITNPTAVVTTLTAGDLEGEYTLRLTVRDNFLAAHSIDQVITVDKSLPASAGLFGVSLLLSGLLIWRGRSGRGK